MKYTLQELDENNDTLLFSFLKENEAEYRLLVSDEVVADTLNQFQDKLMYWFCSTRLNQYIITTLLGDEEICIGTIFFYSYNQSDSSIYCSCYFAKQVRGKSIAMRMMLKAINDVQKIVRFDVLKFSVYLENKYMQSIARKLAEYTEIHQSIMNEDRLVKEYRMSIKNIQTCMSKAG